MQRVAGTSADPRREVVLSKAQKEQALLQLNRMLAHPLFSQSKRYAPFLRYVVEKTLDSEDGALKERMIGIEVLGRAPDYDNNNDPAVRVIAGEVRRRLAQYYQSPEHEAEPRINLYPGSYIPEFSFERKEAGSDDSDRNRAEIAPSESSSSDPEPPLSTRSWRADNSVALPVEVSTQQAATALVDLIHQQTPRPETPITGATRTLFIGTILILLGFVAFWAFSGSDRLLKTIWGNVLDSGSPVRISAGDPNFYLDQSVTSPQKASTGQDHLRANVLSYSEVEALLRLVTFLDHRQGSFLQAAASTTFSDLRRGPTILLGGLNNPWTMRSQENLRFRMATNGKGVDWIVDIRSPEKKDWVIDVAQPYSVQTADFAIVARFTDPNTRQPTLIVAGLGENGTRAASEFMTDPQTVAEVGKKWWNQAKGKNFEVVLQTQLINGAYGSPKVLAKEIW